jgi:WD40 repeat protein
MMSITLIGIPTASVQAQPPPSYLCKNRHGAFYRPDLFARIEPYNRRIVLADARSGKTVQVLDGYVDGLELLHNYPWESSWSDDCRFLVGTRPNVNGYRDLILWDIANGGGVYHVFSGIPLPTSSRVLSWEPSSAFAIVRGDTSTWVIDIAGRTQVKVTDNKCGFSTYHFNVTRRLLVGVKVVTRAGAPGYCLEGEAPTEDAITVFDLNTGAEVRRIVIPGLERKPTFVPSPDGHTLAVRDVPNGFAVHTSFLLLADIDTGALTELNDGPSAVGLIRFSPDGRYLALQYRYYIRIWDVWALPADVSERKPIHYMGFPTWPKDVRWWRWRFVSNTEIEIGGDGGLTKRFDLVSGQYVQSVN